MAPRSAPASTNRPGGGEGAAVGSGVGDGVARGVGEEVDVWPHPERINTSTDPSATAPRDLLLARTTRHPVAPNLQVGRSVAARREDRANLRAMVVAVEARLSHEIGRAHV